MVNFLLNTLLFIKYAKNGYFPWWRAHRWQITINENKILEYTCMHEQYSVFYTHSAA